MHFIQWIEFQSLNNWGQVVRGHGVCLLHIVYLQRSAAGGNPSMDEHPIQVE